MTTFDNPLIIFEDPYYEQFGDKVSVKIPIECPFFRSGSASIDIAITELARYEFGLEGGTIDSVSPKTFTFTPNNLTLILEIRSIHNDTTPTMPVITANNFVDNNTIPYVSGVDTPATIPARLVVTDSGTTLSAPTGGNPSIGFVTASPNIEYFVPSERLSEVVKYVNSGGNTSRVVTSNLITIANFAAQLDNTSTFDDDVSGWDTSNILNMYGAFQGATAFNSFSVAGMDNWDTSNVFNMAYMFAGAAAFNQPIGSWDTTKVLHMNNMFDGATVFDQDLSGWTVTGLLLSPPPSFDAATSAGWMAGEKPTFGAVDDTDKFVTVWMGTTANITVNSAFTTYNYDVDWGDGTLPDTGVTGNIAHVFSGGPGAFAVKISGTFPAVQINNGLLYSIEQWGSGITWESFEEAFKGSSKLTMNAQDAPVVSPSLTSMREMFTLTHQVDNGSGDFSAWDTSNVTDMSGMFHSAIYFDRPLGNWDTNSVINMSNMFIFTDVFNQPLGDWDVSNVTDMSGMFESAILFNDGDLVHAFHTSSPSMTEWNVSSVTNMSDMFNRASSFNQPIGNWERVGANPSTLANVTNMSHMFQGTPVGFFIDEPSFFNQPIGNWNTSNVTDMRFMFSGNRTFNQDIGGWNVGNVTTMINIFYNAISFNNGDLQGQSNNPSMNNWNTSSVTSMQGMFLDAISFNQPVGNWNTSKVISMTGMFQDTIYFNQPLGNWNTGNVIFINNMFDDAIAFNQDIGNWDVSNVNISSNLGFREMFKGAISFNNGDLSGQSNKPSIGSWNTSSATNMYGMFNGAIAFNQDIGGWDVTSVTGFDTLVNPTESTMNYMFNDASSFNHDLSKWCPGLDSKPPNFDTGATSWQYTPDWHPTWGQFKPTLVSQPIVFVPYDQTSQIVLEFPTTRVVNSFGDFTDADVGGTPISLTLSQGTLSTGTISPPNVVTVTYKAPSSGSGLIELFVPYGQSVDVIPDPDLFSGKLGYPIYIFYGVNELTYFPANYSITSCILSAQKSRSEFLYTPSSTETYNDVERSILCAIQDAIRVRYIPNYLLPFESNPLQTLLFYFFDPTGVINPPPSATRLADYLLTNQTSISSNTERSLRNYINKIFGSLRNFMASFFNESTSSRDYTSSFGCGSIKLVKVLGETDEC